MTEKTHQTTRLTLAPPTAADEAELAADMRSADRLEVALAGGLTPCEAVRQSVALSDVALAARVGGRLHCVFGAYANSLADADAVAWMLCTREPERRPRRFLSIRRRGFAALREALPGVQTLSNAVHTENAAALRCLAWCGAWFSVRPAVPGRIGGSFVWFGIDIGEAEKGG